MTPQTNLRQRKQTTNNKKKSAKPKEKFKAKDTKKEDPDSVQQEAGSEIDPDKQTLSDTFFAHPLVRIAPIVLLPYLIYNATYYIALKRPDIVSMASLGLVNLRPALGREEQRQLLILGPEIIDNRLIAAGLVGHTKLEVAHETFDSEHYFSRDGSVSWFQLMRFVDAPEASNGSMEGRIHSWENLCLNRTGEIVQQFQPRQYDYSACPSTSSNEWSNCWARTCINIVGADYGCAWSSADTSSTSKEDQGTNEFNAEFPNYGKCSVPFARILHQTKHPLSSIHSLHDTFCDDQKLFRSFRTLISTFFPHRSWDDLPCSELMAWYIIDFHTTLLKAREAGLIHAMFHVENTSPCQVASLSGYMDHSTVVYEPNVKQLQVACQGETNDKSIDPKTFMASMENNNKKSKKGADFSLDDFSDPELKQSLEGLISQLGYDNAGDAEFI